MAVTKKCEIRTKDEIIPISDTPRSAIAEKILNTLIMLSPDLPKERPTKKVNDINAKQRVVYEKAITVHMDKNIVRIAKQRDNA